MTPIMKRTTRLVLSLLVGLAALIALSGPASAGNGTDGKRQHGPAGNSWSSARSAPANVSASPEQQCANAGGLDLLAYQTRAGAFFTTNGTTLTITTKWTRATVVSENPVGVSFIDLNQGKSTYTTDLHYEAPAGRSIVSYIVCGLLD